MFQIFLQCYNQTEYELIILASTRLPWKLITKTVYDMCKWVEIFYIISDKLPNY